ncbi:MAG: hypothetical protein ABI564_08565 [Ideonella sp.]
MLSLQPRLSLEIPHGPSRSLSFRRLRRPTPLPTLHRPFKKTSWLAGLGLMLQMRQR